MTHDARYVRESVRAAGRHHPWLASVVLLCVVLTVTAVGGTAVAALNGVVRAGSYTAGAGGGVITVLAIGSDVGPPLRPGDPTTGRADGIHLFVVDTATDRMTVVDIPRDSLIGGTKVNAHLAFGGPARLEAQLEAWSGLTINYHVLGSFQSLEAITQMLGGITVEVPQRMADRFSGTDLQPGPQLLDPGQALAFSRDRKSLIDGDVGRSRNQTRLMLAALEQTRATTTGDVGALIGLLATIRQHTVSDIPPGRLLALAQTALRIPPENIRHVTLTGPFGFVGSQSVLYPQPGGVFDEIRAGQVGPV